MLNKKIINIVRGNYSVSKVITSTMHPIQRLCALLEEQIKIKVWANGRRVKYDGIDLKFPKDLGIYYCTLIFWNGVNGYEPLTWRVIRKYLTKSDTFIDVGSNIGFYSVLAKKINPQIVVHAFEPIPDIYGKNLSFHEANDLQTSNVHNIAIGETNGTAEIYLPFDSNSIEEQNTGTLRADSWQYKKVHDTIAVETKTIDSILLGKLPGDRVFIKIDVEDYEASVLKGALEAIDRCKPVIVCEILPRSHGNQETAEIIQSIGYIPFGISKSGLIKFHQKDFLEPRDFSDFLLIPSHNAPNKNYISYENLDF